MKQEFNFSTFDDISLYASKNLVENARGVVIIVHGLCEHLGRYDYVTDKLNESGYSVYRFDHRGHGKSGGKKVYYSKWTEISDDINTYFDLVKAEQPNKPIFVLGHSMGGYSTTCFATRFPGKADGILLSGALVRYNHPMAGSLPMELPPDVYMPNALGDGVCSDPAVVEAYAQDPLVEKEISVSLMNSMGEGVEWLKAHAAEFVDPTLIMHGCCDGLVSEKDSRDLFSEIGSQDKGLIIYAKLFHEILNEPSKDEILCDITRWLDKHSV